MLLGGCVGEERERELGQTLATEINAQVPLIRDRDLNLYLSALGERLAQASERPQLPLHFFIINSDIVNAFALPGGYIYISRGLIDRTENVGQLGAVVAHEIGHVAARHGAEQWERHLRTSSVVSVLYQMILGHEPELLDRTALRLGTDLWFARHSRRAEQEADRLAVDYLVAAGLDPRNLLELLDRLAEEEARSRGWTAEWFSTHPTPARRIAALEEEIRAHLRESERPLIDNVASYAPLPE